MKLKVIPEDGQYIGYVLENDEVVYNTGPCKDAITASRTLSQYAAQKTFKPLFPSQRINKGEQPPFPPNPAPLKSSASAPPVRRCCGRG